MTDLAIDREYIKTRFFGPEQNLPETLTEETCDYLETLAKSGKSLKERPQMAYDLRTSVKILHSMGVTSLSTVAEKEILAVKEELGRKYTDKTVKARVLALCRLMLWKTGTDYLKAAYGRSIQTSIVVGELSYTTSSKDAVGYENFKPMVDQFVRELDNYEYSAKTKYDHMKGVRKCLNMLLVNHPYTELGEIDIEQLEEIKGQLEKSTSAHTTKGYLRHFCRFIDRFRGVDFFNELYDDKCAKRWFVGLRGDFLFEEDLAQYKIKLRSTGMLLKSINAVCDRIKIACRVLNKMKGITKLTQINFGDLEYIYSMMHEVNEEFKIKTIRFLGNFVEFVEGYNPFKQWEKSKLYADKFDTDSPEGRDFLERYSAFLKYEELRGMRPTSLKNYAQCVLNIYTMMCKFKGTFYVENTTEMDIYQLKNEVPPEKINYVHAAATVYGCFYEYHFGRNITRDAKVIWDSAPIHRYHYKKADYDLLWNNANVTEKLIMALGGTMGLRREEIAGIKLTDVSEDHILFVRGKGHGKYGKHARMKMTPQVIDAYHAYLDYRADILETYGDFSEGKLFVRDKVRAGAAMSDNYLGNIMYYLGQRVGVKATTHALRRYFAASGMKKTHDIRQVCNSMRHFDPKTTTIYIQNAEMDENEILTIYLDN